jgi:hypothetical protein
VFNSLNDSIVGTTNNRVMITGNESFNTNHGGKSVDLRGTGKMVYAGNFWDVPPTAHYADSFLRDAVVDGTHTHAQGLGRFAEYSSKNLSRPI